MAKPSLIEKDRIDGEFMRRALMSLPFLLVFLVFTMSCNKQAATLVQVQQIRSGDYVVVLLNDTGAVKQHSNKFMLEIRNATSNDWANVSNVQIQANMRMPGMGPMFGNVSSTRQAGPGRYEFDADFSMAGQWSFLVTFDPNGRAQFNLNAQ
ncbi:MAG: hypothetical protein DMG14_13910 [Acidobacteria bacterium]|nr:MAG: hypothetical protein DMG14_13910 [Acidobacteriota bacterium]